MIWIIIIFAVFILDQASKYYIVNTLKLGDSIPIIKDFFSITYIENKGAAMGILQNARYFFIPLTILVIIVMLFVLKKVNNRFFKLSISFIIGGALGNLIDRIMKGSVVDFLDFTFGSFNFWIFNISDAFLVVGTIFLAYYLLFMYKDSDEIKILNSRK